MRRGTQIIKIEVKEKIEKNSQKFEEEMEAGKLRGGMG